MPLACAKRRGRSTIAPTPFACPTCAGDLAIGDGNTFRCAENHQYTAIGLELTTNIAALRALWLAIRALEDDAASLTCMANNYGDKFGMPAEARRAEAEAARAAALTLREHAQRAQDRLDALPIAPLSVREESSEPG